MLLSNSFSAIGIHHYKIYFCHILNLVEFESDIFTCTDNESQNISFELLRLDLDMV